jgi:DNA end-binding protein Ku
MPQPYWKGYLKLSLVTCAVSMSPATSSSEKVRFHTINRKTGNRVRSQYVDSVTGKKVKEKDEAKGYDKGEDDFVVITDDDLDAVDLDTVKTINIETFVPARSVEWIYLEKPHYLVPNDAVGEEAFAVIREAMKSEDVMGISRLVIGRRERSVVLQPLEKGIVLWTLRFFDEVRSEDEYWQDTDEKSDPKVAAAVATVVERQTRKWSSKMVHDPVQEQLLSIIAKKKRSSKTSSKKSGNKKQPAGSSKASRPDNVIDIMDALKKSLAGQGRKKTG